MNKEIAERVRRELVDEVRWKAEQYKEAGLCKLEDIGSIAPDSEKFQAKYDSYTDDKVTIITYYFRNRETRTIWCIEATEQGILRKAYDTQYTLYPLVWINWDYIRDCYHGQAMISGLIPNQIFVNKLWAMMMVQVKKMAFPKVIYNNTLIKKWDNRIGAAIPINGGDVSNVAKIMDPATISPQISQFIQLTVEQTEQSLGATSVALGKVS